MDKSHSTKTRLPSLIPHVSSLIHNRSVFLTVVAAVAILKLLLAAFAPASFELQDIVHLFSSANAPLGPWVALYPPLYVGWIAKDTIGAWLVATPVMMDLNLLLISLLFRLPAFAFDLATLVVLYFTGLKLGSPERARVAGLIWYLNPYSFLGTVLIGVPDIIATFLIASSLGLIFSRRLLPAAAIIGIGIFMKLFPLILLPPLFIYLYSQGFSRRRLVLVAGITLLGLLGYLGWVLPSNVPLTDYTPVTQPIPFLTGPPAFLGTGYTLNDSTFGMITLYCLFILFAKRDALIPTLVTTFMVYYLVSNPYPQYFVWALPLIALDVVFVSRARSIISTVFYALAFVFWFITSTAFLTPSGYSLLMFPLNAPAHAYLLGLRRFLEQSPVLGPILLPIVYSTLYASTLIFVIDTARSWFRLPLPKSS